MARNAKESNIK